MGDILGKETNPLSSQCLQALFPSLFTGKFGLDEDTSKAKDGSKKLKEKSTKESQYIGTIKFHASEQSQSQKDEDDSEKLEEYRKLRMKVEGKLMLPEENLWKLGIKQIKNQPSLVREAQDMGKLIVIEHNSYKSVKYCLYVSKYEVELNVRFVEGDISLDKNMCLHSGAFGYIFDIEDDQSETCLKSISYTSKNSITRYFAIRDILTEIGLAKLVGGFGIGPRIHYFNQFDDQHYDAVIYEDSVCYKMQKLRTFKDVVRPNPRQHHDFQYYYMLYNQINSDLQTQLFKLHQSKLIHRDIKCSNVLYHEARNQFIFCDFGISHSVSQSPQTKSKVPYVAGTVGYMSQQLERKCKRFKLNKKEFSANLYLNDLHAFKVTMNKVSSILFSGPINVGESQENEVDSPKDKISLSKKLNEDTTRSKETSIKQELRILQLIYGYNSAIQSKRQQLVKGQPEEINLQKKKKCVGRITKYLRKEQRRTFVLQNLLKQKGLKWQYPIFTFQLIVRIENELKSIVPNHSIIIQSLLQLLRKANSQLKRHATIDMEMYSFIISLSESKVKLENKKKETQPPDTNGQGLRSKLILCQYQILRKVSKLVLQTKHQRIKLSLIDELSNKLDKAIRLYRSDLEFGIYLEWLAVYTAQYWFHHVMVKKAVQLNISTLLPSGVTLQTHKQKVKIHQTLDQLSINHSETLQNLAILCSLIALQCIRIDPGKAYHYNQQAVKTLQLIPESTHTSYFSCSGIIQMTNILLNFNAREYQKILWSEVQKTFDLITEIYGRNSYYFHEFSFVVILLSLNEGQNPFTELFNAASSNFFSMDRSEIDNLLSKRASLSEGRDTVDLHKYNTYVSNIIQQELSVVQSKNYLKLLSKVFPHLSLHIPKGYITGSSISDMLIKNKIEIKKRELKPWQQYFIDNVRILNMRQRQCI